MSRYARHLRGTSAATLIVAVLLLACPALAQRARNIIQVKRGLNQEIADVSTQIVNLTKEIAGITPQTDAAQKAADDANTAYTDAHKAVDDARKALELAQKTLTQANADLEAASAKVKAVFEADDTTIAVKKAVAEARKAATEARDKALQSLRETADYKTADAAAKEAQKRLDALKTQTPPDPVDINYQTAALAEKQGAVTKLEKPVLDADADYVAADAQLQAALAAEKKHREALALRILQDPDWMVASKAASDAQTASKAASALLTDTARKLPGVDLAKLKTTEEAKRMGAIRLRLQSDRDGRMTLLKNLQDELRSLN